jgi:CheY-like chemotaxis protein
MTKRVLIVDDDPAVRTFAAEQLKAAGCAVATAESGEEALAALNGDGFDLLIFDLSLPDMTGFDLVRAAGANLGKARVVFVSGYGDQSDHGDAKGASYLAKPLTAAQLSGLLAA